MFRKILLIIIGLFLSLVILEVGLRSAGFFLSLFQEKQNSIKVEEKKTYTILCLGESTSAQPYKCSYPQQLESMLNNQIETMTVKVVNKAAPGLDSNIILSRLDKNLKKYNVDMVIAMMGINDAPIIKLNRNNMFTSFMLKLWNSLRVVKLAKIIIVSNSNKKIFSDKYNNIRDINKPVKNLSKLDNGRKDFYSLGDQAMLNGNYEEAESFLKKGLRDDPNNEAINLLLAGDYFYQGKYALAEQCLLRAIDKDYGEDQPYLMLGEIYRKQEKFSDAKRMFIKALELNPNSSAAYPLGAMYDDVFIAEKEKCESFYKKAISSNFYNAIPYISLANYYREKKLYNEEMILVKNMQNILENEKTPMFSFDRCIGYIAMYYLRMKDLRSANTYFKKLVKRRRQYYSNQTKINYRKMNKILQNNDIAFVCVQYPVRNIRSLKMYFDKEEDIIFVSNEKSFKKAVFQESYGDYFTDSFGGEFGHCTCKGNRLLAENVGKVILEKAFKK